jgi:hypothetical protein
MLYAILVKCGMYGYMYLISIRFTQSLSIILIFLVVYVTFVSMCMFDMMLCMWNEKEIINLRYCIILITLISSI